MSKKEKKGLMRKALGVESIKGAFTHTVDMVKSTNPKNQEYIKETFQEAMERHGVKKEDQDDYLLKIYRNLKIQIMVLLVGSIYILYFGVISAFFDEKYLMGFTYSLITFALFSLMAQYSLRCFQIREKKLGMLKEWFVSPKNWFPRKIKKADLESKNEP